MATLGGNVDEPTTSVRDLGQVLLEAKLSCAPPRVDAVSRAKLIDTARSSECRVVALTAPAGYGKSTFLSEWASLEDRRTAWVSLDRFDDDPSSLVTLLASAYARIDPDRPDIVVDLLGPGVSVLGRAAPRLAAAFASSPVPFVLMLDDLHELQSPVCHDVLGLIVARIPRGSQLVSASRHEQPHVPRLRASANAIEFGVDELALDQAGAQQVFSAERVSLPAELATLVTERTEGWPVGLYLSAVIAKENGGKVNVITGDDPYVADYLYSESLRRQPEDVQRFLCRTAVVDQLSGPLCDALLGSSDAAVRLRLLESSSLFVTPLDRQRQWYRYHALFREFLLAELRRREPESIDGLHVRAANWYESNGFPAGALEHLLQTNEQERAAVLLTELALPTYYSGQLATAMRWLSMLGDKNIQRSPPLAVLAGWGAVLTGDTIGAERWAAFVEDASFDSVPADGSASFDSARAMLRAVMCPGGPDRMMADAALAVAQEPSWSPWRDNALWLLGEAHLMAGSPETARPLLAEASQVGVALGGTDGVVLSESELALLAMDRGDWPEASDHMDRARAMMEQNRMQDYVMSILAYAAAARLALHRNQEEGVRAELARAMRTRPSATYVLPFIAVRSRNELAKLFFARGELATARQLLREIDDILLRRPALGTLVDQVERLRGALTSGTLSAGAQLPLTPAELRLLPYLQTHLTLAAIGERLFVSRHTVNSQVKSIYRKFGVSSRQAAVDHATAIGVLGG